MTTVLQICIYLLAALMVFIIGLTIYKNQREKQFVKNYKASFEQKKIWRKLGWREYKIKIKGITFKVWGQNPKMARITLVALLKAKPKLDNKSPIYPDYKELAQNINELKSKRI